MSIWFDRAYARVWEIQKQEEKYSTLTLSTSEKSAKNEGEYAYSNWLATAVGQAHQNIVNGIIKPNDRVVINKGKITNEKWVDKEGNKRSTVRITIFDFSPSNLDQQPTNNNAAPAQAQAPAPAKSDQISDDDLPF